jgi:hypothetical protein
MLVYMPLAGSGFSFVALYLTTHARGCNLLIEIKAGSLLRLEV